MIPVLRLTPESEAEIAQARAFLAQQVRLLFPMLPGLGDRPDLAGLKSVYIEAGRSAFFVAFENGGTGEVVGTAALRPYDDRLPDMRGVYDRNTTAEVCRCYVRPDQRGRGIGTALLRQVSAFAQEAGFSTLCLHTHRHLPGGLPFWLRQGFGVRLEHEANDHDIGVVYMDRRV